MIQAYKINIGDKPQYMYSKAQFEEVLGASGLVNKKIVRFYTELKFTDDSVLCGGLGYSFIVNNIFIIETEDGDWYEFYIPAEGAFAFTKNIYLKEKFFTVTGDEVDDIVVAEIAYSPFLHYRKNTVVGFEIIDDENLAFVPYGFDKNLNEVLPQSLKLQFEDGSALTILGDHDYICVNFNTSIPQKRFRNKVIARLKKELTQDISEVKIKDINKFIEFFSKELTYDEKRNYNYRGLQNPMTRFWSVDLFTNTQGYGTFNINHIKAYKANNPASIAKALLTLAIEFIEYIDSGEHHREFRVFSFDTEEDNIKITHNLYYYFDKSTVEEVWITLEKKRRYDENLVKLKKQTRWIPFEFIADIWCIGKRYNLDSQSLNKLQAYFEKNQ
ncbi:MAG: hypothetical protein WC292_01150 [Clostridia bacterium]